MRNICKLPTLILMIDLNDHYHRYACIKFKLAILNLVTFKKIHKVYQFSPYSSSLYNHTAMVAFTLTCSTLWSIRRSSPPLMRNMCSRSSSPRIVILFGLRSELITNTYDIIIT